MALSLFYVYVAWRSFVFDVYQMRRLYSIKSGIRSFMSDRTFLLIELLESVIVIEKEGKRQKRSVRNYGTLRQV